MTSNEEKYHVFILTEDNVLLYIKYFRKVSHVEVYQELKDSGVTVKDCIINNDEKGSIKDFIAPAVFRWTQREFNESVDLSSLTVRLRELRLNRYVVAEISGKTTEGNYFSMTPSAIISSKNNLFSDIFA